MKKFLSFVFAGIIGGVITLAGVHFFNIGQQTKFVYQQRALPVRQAAYRQESNVSQDFVAAAERATPAVVHISAKEVRKDEKKSNSPFDFWEEIFGDNPFFDQPKEGTGSGVIFTQDGYIVTNNHVVEFADELEVILYDNRKFKAKLVGTYPQSDLAVIKIEAAGLPTLQLADSDKARIGEWVLAIGNPFELNSTVTAGIISAKDRDIDIIKGDGAIESFIQTDAAVNPGNSGGALVDSQGRLLGITTAIATPTGVFSGYSFAIPVNFLVKVVNDIINYGSYQRPYLGIDISDLDSEYAKELGVNISQGVVVEAIADGSSAQMAGVHIKDVIVKLNGKPVKSAPELLELIGRKRIGETIVLTINRKNRLREISILLKKG